MIVPKSLSSAATLVRCDQIYFLTVAKVLLLCSTNYALTKIANIANNKTESSLLNKSLSLVETLSVTKFVRLIEMIIPRLMYLSSFTVAR